MASLLSGTGRIPDDVLYTCLDLGQGIRLNALGQDRLGLRLGVLGPERPAALKGRWEGLHVSLEERLAEPGHPYLVMHADPGFERVFWHLADDLYDALREIHRLELAVETVPGRIQSILRLWAGFLSRPAQVLERRQALGWYAELKFLEDRLAPQVGWARAVQAWRSPEGSSPQDFVFPAVLLDVKSTGESEEVAWISSVEQLDPPSGLPVWLVQGLRADPGTDSLQRAVNRILDACAGSEEVFTVTARMRFAQAGLLSLEEDVEDLGISGWRFHDASAPAFPRILARHVPAGAGGVTYRISLRNQPDIPGAWPELCAVLLPAHSGDLT